jgi:uncharacterized membrane protein YjfL (UPF0719 family)
LGGDAGLLPHGGLEHPPQRQLQLFLIWSVAGLSVQVLTYVLLGRLVPACPSSSPPTTWLPAPSPGTVALVVGIMNAACMS